MSQTKLLLGLPSNRVTLLLGAVAMLALFLARTFLTPLLMRGKVPQATAEMATRLAPLVVVVCGTLAVVTLNLDITYGVAVVGQVSSASITRWRSVSIRRPTEMA